MPNELSPNQFLAQCKKKPIYTAIQCAGQVNLTPVRVTKSALKSAFESVTKGSLVRYEEYPNSFVITLIYY